jgi:outer membrane protein assembly factor BamB
VDSTSEAGLWVICPVCHKANPAGTRFCQYCWGAAIHAKTVLTSEELEETTRRYEVSLKRRKKLKVAAISITPVVVLAAAFLFLHYFTDTITKPPQEVTSNSFPGEWTMFRHDLARTGTTGPSDVLPQGILKWSFSTGAAIHSSPAVVDGTVYFGSEDYKLYALNADTGVENWEFKTGSWVDSSPSIVGGKVYFGSNDGSLYALDAHSGEKLWDFKTKYPVGSSPAIASNGVVYFGSEDYYLYALNADNGKKLWSYDIGSPAVSSPVVANGIVYIGGGDGYSYALNSVSGQRRLRFKTHYAVYSSPAVSDTTVYVATTNSLLYAFDGMARTVWREHEIKNWWVQLWAFGVPGIPQPPPQSGFLWSLYLGGGNTSSPVISGDTMYLGCDRNLLAVDLQNQKILWKFETGGIVRSSPAVVGSTVFVGSEDGRLYAVDATTGEKLWDFLTGDKITSSPTVVNGIIYVGSHDGNLYAIE